MRRNGSNKPSESYRSEFVSGNYFSTFGIPPYIGRTLTPQDDTKGAPAVAMMSFRTWQEKFGQDRSVVGGGFVVNGKPFTVVGVTPPGFYGDRVESNPPAFFIPLADEPVVTATGSLLEEASLDWLDLIGRVVPGANIKAMEAQMQAAAAAVPAQPHQQGGAARQAAGAEADAPSFAWRQRRTDDAR